MPSPRAPDPPSHDANDQEQASERDPQPLALPDPATILSEETFVSPKGREYRILRTNQTDEEPFDDDDPVTGNKKTRARKRPPAKKPRNAS
jgi:hypothetical protein